MNNWDHVETLLAATRLERIRFGPNVNSTLGVSQPQIGRHLHGQGGILSLSSCDISGATIENLYISGSGSATYSAKPNLRNVTINGPLGMLNATDVVLRSLTVTQAANYWLHDVRREEPGFGIVDFANVAAYVALTAWSGELEVRRLDTGGTLEVLGEGTVKINSNCVGGTLLLSQGMSYTDESGGAVTVTEAFGRGGPGPWTTGGGGGGLTQQDVADAMRLTPAGTVNAGSVDAKLGTPSVDLAADIATRMPTTHIDATLGAVDNVVRVLNVASLEPGAQQEIRDSMAFTTAEAPQPGSVDEKLDKAAQQDLLLTVDGKVDNISTVLTSVEDLTKDIHAVEITGITPAIEAAAGTFSNVHLVLLGTNSDSTTNPGQITSFKPSDGTEFARLNAPTDPAADNLTGARAV